MDAGAEGELLGVSHSEFQDQHISPGIWRTNDTTPPVLRSTHPWETLAAFSIVSSLLLASKVKKEKERRLLIRE